jgi:hypothetical protein
MTPTERVGAIRIQQKHTDLPPPTFGVTVFAEPRDPLLQKMETAMSEPFKFHAPLRLSLELREHARKSGRTLSDVILRAVESGLGAAPAEMPDAVVDRVERGAKGSKATAAYLSPPLSSAISRLAREQSRSASWVMRDPIRSELRRRGILPTPAELHGGRDPVQVEG